MWVGGAGAAMLRDRERLPAFKDLSSVTEAVEGEVFHYAPP